MLFDLIIKATYNLIVIPFNTREESGGNNFEYIYTQLEIGEPPRKTDSLINFKDSFFYFSDMDSLNIDLYYSYNSSISSSFNLLSSINISNFKNIISEEIYFYTDINCTNKSRYNISKILYPDLNINQSLFNIIGMQISNANKTFNLIKERKNNYRKFSTYI